METNSEQQKQQTSQDTQGTPETFGRDYVERLRADKAKAETDFAKLRDEHAELAKKVEAIEAEKVAQEQRKLEEQGQYKKLLEDERMRTAQLQNQLIQDRVNGKIRAAFAEKGVTDPVLVDNLIPGVAARVNLDKLGDDLKVDKIADWDKLVSPLAERLAPPTPEPSAPADTGRKAQPVIATRPSNEVRAQAAPPTVRELIDSSVDEALAKHKT